MYDADTIAAVSTPFGNGGIAIIRISGPQSFTVASIIAPSINFGGSKSRRFLYSYIIDPSTFERIDEAVILLMPSPHSYTTEDVVEVQVHGGVIVANKVLSLVLSCGVRPALNGEFTKRAFLNGRINLLQAESVIDIITAQNEAELKIAARQSDSPLFQKLYHLKDLAASALSLVEAFIDFPEEDIPQSSLDEISTFLAEAITIADAVSKSSSLARLIRHGVIVTIAGKPNVGKSSLLNALLMENRSIVTDIPGTTRDTIEETILIDDLPIRLVDTAGIRESDDFVEKIGVEMAKSKISDASLVLFLIDSSSPPTDEDLALYHSIKNKLFLPVITKSDLVSNLSIPLYLQGLSLHWVSVSNEATLSKLKAAIRSTILEKFSDSDLNAPSLSHHHQIQSLNNYLHHLGNARTLLELGSHLELISVDIRDALYSLGEITGETTPDDILDNIFSRFCIGK